METAQPQAEKKRRPSIGQKFEQMIAEKKKQEQEEEQKQRRLSGDARRKSLEKRWADAIKDQMETDAARLEEQKNRTMEGFNVTEGSGIVKNTIEQLHKMFLARSSGDHAIRALHDCARLRFAKPLAPEVIQARTPEAFLVPAQREFLDKLLRDNEDKPVLLPVGLRGVSSMANISPPLSVVAMVMRMPDGEPAICLSVEAQPGQEFNPHTYGPIQVAVYDPPAQRTLFETTITVDPEGGWEAHRAVLDQKIKSIETFLVKQMVRGDDGVEVEMVMASHKLLYHEMCPSHPMIPLSYVDVSLLDPLNCTRCGIDLKPLPAEEQWAWVDPQAAAPVLLCKNCAADGHGVVASTDTKQIELNTNVYFNVGTSIISENSHGILDQVARVLNDHPLKVRIEGHGNYVRPDGSLANDITRNKGEEKCTLLELSQRRAQRVGNYLVNKGVSRTLVIPVGCGGSRLITTNPAEITKNMRVEIHFLTEPTNPEPEATGADPRPSADA